MSFAYFLLFILSVTAVSSTATELVCGDNEIVDECPATCASDYCPKSENDESVCERPKPCPEPACKCRVNHRRAEDGTCIPTTECPPLDCSLRPFEQYDPCPPYCPTDDCNQATPDGRCPFPFGILVYRTCHPRCRCITGYWRNNGICVPFKDCPEVQLPTKSISLPARD